MRANPTILKSTVVAGLGGLLFGFDTAVISGTTEALRTVFGLSPASLGVTVSIALWGTVLGSMLAGIPAERIGRRDSLRITAWLFLLGAAGCGLAWDWPSLLFFRFLEGLGVGLSSVVGPMYIAEIAPARIRGRLVGVFQFNIVLGILVAYLSNGLVGLASLGDLEWRVKLGLGALPAVAFLALLFSIPRSPRWLVKKQRLDEARQSLVAVGEEDVEGSLAEIVKSIDADHGHADEPLFSAKYKVPVLLAIAIGFFNQMTGINAILYYLNDIFASAGFSKVSADIQAVAVGATNLLFTMVAMSVIDRIGRKVLLLVGAVGTGVCLAGVALVFLAGVSRGLLLPLLIGFIAFFAFSQGAVIWVYLSEVFPNRVRGKGQSLGAATHWLMNAIVGMVFPLLAARSSGLPFLFFAVMMVVQFVVVLRYFPETKGVSLEQMQKKLGIA